MDEILKVGVLLLSLAFGAMVAAELLAFLSVRPEVTWRDAWAAGSNLWLKPQRYLRPERVVLFRSLNYATAVLGILGVMALVAAAVRR